MDRQDVVQLYGQVRGGLVEQSRVTGQSVAIAFEPGVDMTLRLYVDGPGVVGAELGPAPNGARQVDTIRWQSVEEDDFDVPGQLVPPLKWFVDLASESGQSFETVALVTCEIDGYVRGFPPCSH